MRSRRPAPVPVAITTPTTGGVTERPADATAIRFVKGYAFGPGLESTVPAGSVVGIDPWADPAFEGHSPEYYVYNGFAVWGQKTSEGLWSWLVSREHR